MIGLFCVVFYIRLSTTPIYYKGMNIFCNHSAPPDNTYYIIGMLGSLGMLSYYSYYSYYSYLLYPR